MERQTNQDDLFDSIVKQVADGASIMCSFPRRAGKTHLVVRLLEEALSDNKVVLLTPQKVQGQEVCCHLGQKVENKTFRSSVALRGRADIDCLIIEELHGNVKQDQLQETMSTIKGLEAYGCQLVFVFSPFEYDSRNPHPLKVLWDIAPYYKYQLSTGSIDRLSASYNQSQKHKGDFIDPYFQTEIEGNWVVR